MGLILWAGILEDLLQIENFVRWLMDIAIKYGYLGVFLISLTGSLSIIIPIPYTALIFALGMWLDPVLIAFSAGAGSALGEVLGYIIGYYGRFLVSDERRKKLELLAKILDKYGAPVIFIFALTPLPDDLLFIPLGIMHYPPTKALIWCFLGKTAMSFILAYGGRFSIKIVEALLGSEHVGFISVVIAAALLVVAIVIMLKVDWEKYLEKYLR